AAMTSILPNLHDYRVAIAVGAVVLLTPGNLRGTRESGSIFMAPTYLYIVIMLGILGYALVRNFLGDLPPYVPPPEFVTAPTQALGLFLVLRAFSQGAVALTGVEAISDGVPAFKAPEWKKARTTITWAAPLFGSLLASV